MDTKAFGCQQWCHGFSLIMIFKDEMVRATIDIEKSSVNRLTVFICCLYAPVVRVNSTYVRVGPNEFPSEYEDVVVADLAEVETLTALVVPRPFALPGVMHLGTADGP